MEFLDEHDDGRPRLVFKSHQSHSTNEPSQSSLFNNPILLIISLFFSLLFFLSSLFFFQSQFLQPLLFWFSLSLLVGPFAPLSLTGGNVTVGQGHIVEFPLVNDHVEVEKKVSNKRNRGKRFDVSGLNSNGSGTFSEKDSIFDCNNHGVAEKREKDSIFKAENDGVSKIGKNNGGFSNSRKNDEEWSDEDVGLLRKQIVKNPVGKPRRWEMIAEVFKGKYSVDSVISKSKSLGSEKPSDSDSYSKFLKDRKVVDKRLESVDEGLVGNDESGGGEVVVSWSSSEDIALLNALKSFPKEVAMRWEKIAASVPGKSKAACMKRVSDLKKEFRSSKGSG